MKEIRITIKRIWIEIACFIVGFVIAEGLNLYAIIKHKTQWREMWTELPIVLALSVILYALLTVARLLCYPVKSLLSFFRRALQCK